MRMSTAPLVRVFIACSLDGFIAGPQDDLSWLPGSDPHADEPAQDVGPPRDPAAVSYDEFIAQVGALLMGRRTYDVVAGFGVPWSYGPRPVLVATGRPLEPISPTVRAVDGDIASMVNAAKAAAGDKDVYIDGGNLIRQALDAGLIDDMIVTMVPTVLGQGHPLFAGASARHEFDFVAHHTEAHGMVQLRLRPKTRSSPPGVKLR